MSTLTISTAANADRLRQRLLYGMRELERQGIRVFQQERSQGGYTFLSLGVPPGGPESPWVLRRQLAAVLCEVILQDLPEELLDRIVSTNYPQLESAERAAVVRYAQRWLREGLGSTGDTVRRKILWRLLDYLEGNDLLVLEGFITFRLKDYVDRLEEAVEAAIEEILLEKEYEEFVRLLQCFVDSQQTKIPEVHLICTGLGLRLEDAQGCELRPRLPGGISSGSIRPEDLMVSALIGIAPAKVIIHGQAGCPADGEIVNTVRRVFTTRATTCPGCHRCLK